MISAEIRENHKNEMTFKIPNKNNINIDKKDKIKLLLQTQYKPNNILHQPRRIKELFWINDEKLHELNVQI